MVREAEPSAKPTVRAFEPAAAGGLRSGPHKTPAFLCVGLTADRNLKNWQWRLEKFRANPSYATIARLEPGERVSSVILLPYKEWCHELCNATRSLGRDAAPAGRN
jgi:hypothetical protein